MKKGSYKILLLVVMVGVLMVVFTTNKKIVFTEAELAWMIDHPHITVAPDPTYGPIEFFDDQGVFKGVAADYLKWIEDKTPLTFEIMEYSTWPQALAAVQNHEVDMLSAAIKTEQREQYLDFSSTYFSVPNVIVARTTHEDGVQLEDLVGQKVLVIEDYATEDFVSLNYPEIDLITVGSTVEGLSLVSLGTYDYMVVSLAQASYYLPDSKITNIKVCGEINFENEVAFGVKEAYAPLIPILNKTLDAMPEKLKDGIYFKWVNLDLEGGLSKTVVTIIIIGVVTLLGGIGVVLFFNHILQDRVKEKTHDLKTELEERKKIEKDLADLNDHLEDKVKQRTLELQKAFDDLKKIQGDLIESEKMASLSKILINISHHLNTPIGTCITVNSFDAMVLKTIKLKDVDADTHRSIDQLKESNGITGRELERAKEFIRAMRDTTSIKSDTCKKEINICKYFDHLNQSYGQAFLEKNVTFKTRCDLDIGLMISKDHLDNIFGNLINNSLAFAFKDKPSGQINIEATCSERHFMFVYKDNGVGIDKAISKNIFDPLFTTNMGKTSGWGLSVLYNTVKFALDGHVDFKEDSKEGVEFKITFDINKGRIL